MSGHASRRRFLRLGGAAAASGLLPGNLQRALAIPAERKTGTIRDVEHIVILMQENRSFDHYFGCLNGVRGFGDPRAEKSPEGKSVFAQADGKGGTVYPFRLNTMQTSSACLASLDHSWKGSQAAWNAWDCWIPHKTAMTMGHFTRKDIPYYYALADAFTICDAYHASIFGPTNPNRLYFFSGTSGLSVGEDGRQAIENVDDGNWSADMMHDRASFEPFSWSTYPEALQKAGVSWKVYQEYDNFGDNPLASFATFRNVSRESWAYRRARAIVPGSDADNMHTSEGRFLVEAFEHDITAGNLPQVSWIVPSAALSEHPDAPPGYGEHLVSSLMDVFVRHPETWAKTVFILNYDENDGFFDHVPPPVPALDMQQGYSSVPVTGESYHGEPVGLGPRVPALVISPWTKGGWVNSQVFDHTSVLRFIEARFGVPVEHLTPWRRAICGDLTSLFDFSMRDTAWPATLPDTSDYLPKTRSGCRLPKPVLPAFPRLPRQERGQRPTRALPYAFEADLVMSSGTVLRLRNTGRQGATFRLSAGAASRHYTLDTGTSCDIPLDIRSGGTARLHGPNGFFRAFRGNVPVVVRVTTDGDALIVHLDNVTDQSADLDLQDGYGDTAVHMPIPPRTRDALRIPLAAHAHWYDFTVSGPEFELHYAGHVETGVPSRTDPHLG